MSNQKPLLSVCIIFRNDIRSIEHCLKALEPLRKAITCEVVMADTGSTDGSRQVAEQYADVVFDFPWIDDFSAARNAVLERSTGKWQFILDTDEYLGEDVSELKYFLQNCKKIENAAMVLVRNYNSYDMDGDYSDFMSLRLLRSASKIRYEGKIHENFRKYDDQLHGPSLPHVILHHDGYVGLYDGRGKEKRMRNLALLRAKLEESPDDILSMLQYIESGRDQEDIWDIFERAVELSDMKKDDWDRYGPAILRHAAVTASEQKRADVDEWIERAKEAFPASYFIRLDIQYLTFARRRNAEDFAGCIEPGEQYLQALQEYKNGKARAEQRSSTFVYTSISIERGARAALAEAYVREGQFDRAVKMLDTLDFDTFDISQTAQAITTLFEIQLKSTLDTAPMVTKFWEGISKPNPSQEIADARKQLFLETGSSVFSYENCHTEEGLDEFHRHAYTLFLPLEGQSELGNAAAIMESNNPGEMEKTLSAVKRWDEFPPSALAHALENGANFPLPDKPLMLEEMDVLAVRLSQDEDRMISLLNQLINRELPVGGQGLIWMCRLSLAAVQSFGWSDEGVSTERGLALARMFAQVESVFLPFYYSESVTQEANLFALPSLHRFGLYCVQAFGSLDDGDAVTFVQQLREGLIVSPDMKPMVEFLFNWLDKQEKKSHIASASPELLELAKQVKSLLARFDPSDPAVTELKKSPAYQQVAWIIEEPVSTFDGILQ